MEFEEFEILVVNARAATAGRTLPEGFQLFDSWRASEVDIQRAEIELDVQLPDKYKEFMRRHGGGVFLFVELLPIVSPDDHFEDLMEVNRSQFRGVDFIAVAPVGTGDWWGFSIVNGVCGDAVGMWIHDDRTITRSASDFLEFVAHQGLRTTLPLVAIMTLYAEPFWCNTHKLQPQVDLNVNYCRERMIIAWSGCGGRSAIALDDRSRSVTRLITAARAARSIRLASRRAASWCWGDGASRKTT